MSHLGCVFPRRTVQKDGNPWRYLLRIKEGKPLVSDASATNAVYYSVRDDLLSTQETGYLRTSIVILSCPKRPI